MIKRRGVSLPELLVVCFLVGVLVTMALSSGTHQPQAASLAGELAAQLRAARQRAMARREMVGVVLPGPVSLSVTAVEGPVIGRLVRTRDWASEYPRARLLAEPGALSEACSTWLAGRKTLPAVVFDPQGRSQGVRKIVVAGPGSQEVDVTLQGTVTTRPSNETPPLGEVSEPLRIVRQANVAPVIVDVLAAPTVGPQLLPHEVTAIVPNGGHVTLTVHARDNDWDRLFVTWEVEEGQGTFSTPGEQTMVWDGEQWVGTTQFRPADAMQGMQKIALRCRVRDEDGRLNAGGAAASRIVVAVGMPGKLAFWGRPPGATTGDPGLWTCSPEGHSVRQVLPLVTEYATVSWDGMKAVFGSHTEGVIVSNLDGSERTQALPAPFSYASLSPNGKYLAAFHMTPSNNVNMTLPSHLRKSANSLPWYPDRLVIINRHGTHLVDIPVPFAPGLLGDAPYPTVTLPQIVWSAENDEVYFLYGQRQDVVGALPLISPTLHSVTLADPPVQRDSPWPGALGLQMHGSPTPHEIRSNNEQVLEGFRPLTSSLVHVREWTGGGKARRPAGSSLYDGKSVILSGFVQESENVEGGVVLSLWRQGEATACRLVLQGVQPFNDVITWTE